MVLLGLLVTRHLVCSKCDARNGEASKLEPADLTFGSAVRPSLLLHFCPGAPVRISRRSQFALASDTFVGFTLCFDAIFRLWEETHNREVALGCRNAERRRILDHLANAKFVHVSQIPIRLENEICAVNLCP